MNRVDRVPSRLRFGERAIEHFLARREIVLEAHEPIARVKQFAELSKLIDLNRAVKHQLALGLGAFDEKVALLQNIQCRECNRHFGHRRGKKETWRS